MSDLNFRLRDLSCVLAISEELHFGRAAQLMGITQPQLSQMIRRLENVLNVQLFTRTPKVGLTPAGEIIVEMARRGLADVEREIQHARALASGKIGDIRLGFAESAKVTELPRLLRIFRELHPKVELKLTQGNSAQIWDMFERRDFDLLISTEIRQDSNIVSVPIIRATIVLVLPGNHPLADQPVISLKQLHNERFIFSRRSAGPSYYDQILQACHDAGLKPNFSQEANSASLVFALVGAGFGLSFVHSEAGKFAACGTVTRPIKEKMPDFVLWFSWSPRRITPSAELLRQYFMSNFELSQSAHANELPPAM